MIRVGDRSAADHLRFSAAEHAAAVAERIAGGNDIVDDQDPFSFDRFLVDHLERAVEVGFPFPIFELMLFLRFLDLIKGVAIGKP